MRLERRSVVSGVAAPDRINAWDASGVPDVLAASRDEHPNTAAASKRSRESSIAH